HLQRMAEQLCKHHTCTGPPTRHSSAKMKFTCALLISLVSLALLQVVVGLPAPSGHESETTSVILPESAQPLSTLTHLERRQPDWLIALMITILRINHAPEIHKLMITYINCKASMSIDWNDPANKSKIFPAEVNDPDFDISHENLEIANHPSGLYKCDAQYGPSIEDDRNQYFSMYYFMKYEAVTMAIVKEVIAGVQRDAKGKEAVKKVLETIVNKAKEIMG
ncbi:hypothetical protein HK102_009729, partial [Quaeritorhiza haematococci]